MTDKLKTDDSTHEEASYFMRLYDKKSQESRMMNLDFMTDDEARNLCDVLVEDESFMKGSITQEELDKGQSRSLVLIIDKTSKEDSWDTYMPQEDLLASQMLELISQVLAEGKESSLSRSFFPYIPLDVRAGWSSTNAAWVIINTTPTSWQQSK